MSRVSPVQTTFNAGEFDPRLYGRSDISKYSNGCRTLQNMISRVEGGAERRPGSYFIEEVKDSAAKTRLIPFEFSTEQAYVLEFGNEYMRVYKDYSRVPDGGVPYEIATPYQTADLFGIRYIQDADVMYLVHVLYPPMKLSRTADDDWTIEEVDFVDGPYLDENDGTTTLTPSAKTGTITLTASAALFDDPLHEGSRWRIKQDILLQDGSASTGANETLDDVWTAIQFTALGNYDIMQLAIRIKKVGTVTNTAEIIQAYLYTNDTGLPKTPIVGGDEITYGDLTTSYQALRFALETTLTGGTIYWIVLRRGAAPAGGGSIALDIVASGTGMHAISADGASWSAENTKTAWFKLYGDSAWGSVLITHVTNTTTATATVINDLSGIEAVTTWREGAFSPFQGYPGALAFHEQRLILAGTSLQPQTIWGSWTGAYEDFTPPTTEDSGAYTFTIAAEKVNAIWWMSPSTNLIVGTSGGIWRIGSQDSSSPITQSNVKAVPVPRVGSSSVQPINLGNIIVFVQRKGNPNNYGEQVQELSYKFEIDSYVKSNLTTLAKHITKPGIIEWDLQTDPVPIVWAVRSDGTLVGMTYEREQEVIGWHSHPMDGLVESVCVLPGDNQDDVYLIVKRTIGGATKRYIEVLEDMDWGDDQEDAFFVDCGLTYDSTPATTFKGLDHLIGKTVAILADGAVHPPKEVIAIGGKWGIILDYEASVVQVGLPITYDLETLDLEGGSQEGTAQGKLRKVSKALVRFYKSGGGNMGDHDLQDELDFRTTEDDMDSPPALFSGIKDFTFRGRWDREARIRITGSDPLPMGIMTITPTLRTEDA